MMRSERSYNRIYWFGPLCLQVLQNSQLDGLLIQVFPSVTLTVCRQHCVVGLSFEWLAGDINIAWARRTFRDREDARRLQVADAAKKAGLTVRQQELRWGW